MANKREATAAETQAAILELKTRYPEADYAGRQRECRAEGLKDEVCGKCGVVYLACIHFVRCADPDCPMKGPDKRSLLECLLPELSSFRAK